MSFMDTTVISKIVTRIVIIEFTIVMMYVLDLPQHL